MDRRIKGLNFSLLEKRKASKTARRDLQDDLALFLYSEFYANKIADAELLKSARKDLHSTERLLACKTFAECARSDVGMEKKKI